MPLYEYRCNECGEVFEKRMSWSESDHHPACPNCQSHHTQKKLSAIASSSSSSSAASGSSGSSCGSGGHFS